MIAPFSEGNIIQISDLVKDQFPAFYKEQGQGFIDFLKAYYEWLEQPDNPIGQTRGLYEQFDIDRANTEFLNHFRKKYMWSLPPDLLGNQRLLQKHILELYGTKGAQEAIRLLFRLLFNEDIDFYIPSYDIFKLSDNTWIEPRYIEVSPIEDFQILINQIVTGGISGATAVVENYEKRYKGGKESHLLFISNISGSFIVNELLQTENIPIWESPTVLGSIVAVEVIGSTSGYSVGDTLLSEDVGKKVEVAVSSTFDATGSLTIEVVDGGTYYTLDANVTISQGANTTGSGADFKIYSLKDTEPYLYNTDKLLSYANVALDADEYGFPTSPTANLGSIIADCLDFTLLTVGSIDRLLILSPGNNYDGDVSISVVDPYTSTAGIVNSDGTIAGADAIITGEPTIGQYLIDTVTIISSSYGMQNNEFVTFTDEGGGSMVGRVILGGIGVDQGYYFNTKSFLSNDKYLFDGHYYQDFSYVIRASYILDKYIEILKDVVHPAGNAVYSDIRIIDSNQLFNDAIAFRIQSISYDYVLTFDHLTDGEEYIYEFTDINTLDYIGTTERGLST